MMPESLQETPRMKGNGCFKQVVKTPEHENNEQPLSPSEKPHTTGEIGSIRA